MNVPPALIDALIQKESAGNPNAVSPKGAVGLAQAMPGTARDPGYGVRPLLDPRDPVESRRFAGEYLGAMMREFGGDPEAALAAYNYGPGNVKKWLASGGGRDRLPAETRDYVNTLLPVAQVALAGASGDDTMAGGSGIDFAAELGVSADRPAKAPAIDFAAELGVGDGTEIRASAARGPTRPVGDTTAGGLGFMATARASLPPDVNDQIKRLANSTGIDPRRFGVVDGNVVYADEQGNYQRVTPSVFGGPISEIPERFARWLTGGIGPGIPAAAGMAAGAAMGPTGASIPAAGLAAAGADVVRQGADRLMAGESVTDIDVMNSVGQGALAAGGQGLAVGMTKMFNRNPLGVGSGDRVAALEPTTAANANRLIQQGRQQGVDLTVPEATGLPSLLQTQRQLGRMPETADRIGRFVEQRSREQIPNAVYGWLDDISRGGSTGQGAQRLREGAEASIGAARSARQRAAQPLYQRVVNEANNIPDDAFAPIAGDRFLADTLSSIRRDPLYDIPEGLPSGNMQIVDLAKRRIDDMIEAAKRAGENNRVRLLTSKRDKLVDIADQAFPDYPAARAAFAGKSPEVDALVDGPVGIVAKDRPVDIVGNTRTLFDPKKITPEAVREARGSYVRAGRTDDWNAGLRAFIEDRFENASRTLASGKPGNVAGKFSAELFGDERARKVMENAMLPAQYQGFERLMQVLEAAGKALPEGSATATDLMGAAATRAKYGRIGRTLMTGLSPQEAGVRMAEAYGNLRAGRGVQQLADALLDSDNVQLLSRLRMLNPTSEKALAASTQLLTRAGIISTGATAPADFDAPAMQP